MSWNDLWLMPRILEVSMRYSNASRQILILQIYQLGPEFFLNKNLSWTFILVTNTKMPLFLNKLKYNFISKNYENRIIKIIVL